MDLNVFLLHFFYIAGTFVGGFVLGRLSIKNKTTPDYKEKNNREE